MNLPSASIQLLLDQATSVVYRHGEQVIMERDRNKGIFIIESGLVRILSDGHWVGDTLGVGEYFGQHSTPTGCNARSHNDSDAMKKMPSHKPSQYTYEIASEWAILWPMENSVFQEFTRFRLVDTLRQLRKDEVPIFNMLTDDEISSACDGARLLTLDHGANVVHQGDKGNELFVVQDGELQVIRDGKVVQFLSHGDYFGERALLQRGNLRTATVEVISATAELWSITKDAIASFKNLDMSAQLEIRAYLNSKKSDRAKTESFHGLQSTSLRAYSPRTGNSLRASRAPFTTF
jgi:CRP-like cAMP-binding protein